MELDFELTFYEVAFWIGKILNENTHTSVIWVSGGWEETIRHKIWKYYKPPGSGD